MKKYLLQKILHKENVFTLTVLLLAALFGLPAAAESFHMVGIGPGMSSYRTKVGSLYFWGEHVKVGNDAYGSYCLFTSYSKEGDGTVLTEIDPWDSVLSIMTDGDTVIYPQYDSEARKTSVMKINVDGTGKTVLGKGKMHGYNQIDLVKKYKSKYFYTVIDTLYCYDQSTGTNKRLVKGYDLSATANSSSKYVYAVIPKTKSLVVKVVNAQTLKTVGTQTVTTGKGYEVCHNFTTKKYFYFAIRNKAGSLCAVYRMPASGKSAFKRLGELKCKSKSENIDYFFVINDKYAYCDIYDNVKEKDLYYKYTFATKKTSKISLKAFKKATKQYIFW